MKVKPINIFNQEINPIFEGGKGIRISDGTTAGAFAAANCIGTFSGVFAKFINDNGDYVPLIHEGKTRIARHQELIKYSIKAAVSQAKIAFEKAKGMGRIHMNILWEMGGAQEILIGVLQKASQFIHGITCGAGMPYKLAEIVAKYNVSYFPIVSSARAFNILWLRAYKNYMKQLGGVVYEDPWLAGGHNGLSKKEDPSHPESPYQRLVELRKVMNLFKLNDVPIIIAGGVWYLREWQEYIESNEIKPVAFQFGTRPLLTKESPISPEWKKKLLTIKEHEVYLNNFSPTGFYSSGVQNSFLQELIERNKTEIKFSTEENIEFNHQVVYGRRAKKIFIKEQDLERFNNYIEVQKLLPMKTPAASLVFVKEDKYKQILSDQINCIGCLSHCRFSNWKDHKEYTTGYFPDPRSFCISKTLFDISEGANIDNNLMFSGHNAFKFASDPLFKDGYNPTIQELVDAMLRGN